MAGPFRFALDHSWLTIPTGTIGPGIVAALFEYLRLGRQFDATSIWVLLAASSAIAVLLLSARVRALTKALEQYRSFVTSVEHQTVAIDDGARLRARDHRLPASRAPKPLDPSKPRCLRTPEELIAMTKGLTSVERDRVTKDQIGLWLAVNGEIREVWDYRPNLGVAAMLRLPTGTLVHVVANSDIWNRTVLAAKVGDRITVDGSIGEIGSVGEPMIWLKDCELSSGDGQNDG